MKRTPKKTGKRPITDSERPEGASREEWALLKAVAAWVRLKGGNCVITGGIEVQDWAEGAAKFRVAVRCVGRPPEKRTPVVF